MRHGVVLVRGLLKPFQRLGVILWCAVAVHEFSSEQILRFRKSTLRRGVKPLQGFSRVRHDSAASLQREAELELGPRVILFRSLAPPLHGFDVVQRRAVALIEHETELELRVGVTAFSGSFGCVEGGESRGRKSGSRDAFGIEHRDHLGGGQPVGETFAPGEIGLENLPLSDVLTKLRLRVRPELLAVDQDVDAIRHRSWLDSRRNAR